MSRPRTSSRSHCRGARHVVLAALIVAACSDESPPTGPGGPQPPAQTGPAVRIEIAPSNVLLTAPGEAVQLEAIGYDASGAVTDVDVTWSTSDAGVITVTQDGTVTAAADIGSAQITARAGTMSAAPVLGVVAQPVEGAVLVSDEQFVSGPTAVSTAEEYGTGWEYTVRLTGLDAPAAGTVLLATGGAPIAGRVVRTAAAGSEIDVTLALIPLPDMFERLSIQQTLDLAEAPVAVDARLLQSYSVQRAPGGEILLTPLSSQRTWSAKAVPGLYHAAADTEFKLGPFECTASGSVPNLDVPEPEIKITQSLSVTIGYSDAGFEKLAVTGNTNAEFEYRPVFKAEYEGKLDCNYAPLRVIIPVSGFATWAFAGIVPLGIGIELEGKLTIAEVGFEVAASAGASLELGVECSGGGACQAIRTFTPQPIEPTFEFITPESLDDQVHLELGATAYAVARLAFGSPLSESTQFELLEARAGMKQSVDLMTAKSQVEDDDYSSGFDLTSVITLGPGKHLQDALDAAGELLGVPMDFTINLFDDLDPLAESPRGTFTISPATVEAGDSTQLATFTIELDPVTYLNIESIENVEILWKKDDGNGGFTLEAGRPDCSVIEAESGQKKFECETGFEAEHIGEQTFAAFVNAKLFGVPIPVPLEIAKNGTAMVTVQPAVACGQPDEWSIWGIFDESRGFDDEHATISGPEVDYLSVSGGASTTSTGNTWSPSVFIDAEAIDYVRVIPLAPPPFADGLFTVAHATGSVDAVVSPNGCCGRYGDATARIAVVSTWGGSIVVEAGASWSGNLSADSSAQVDTIVNRWIGWGEDSEWEEVTTRIDGYVRHRGDGNKAEVTGNYNVQVLDIVDGNGVSVPAVICSAAGYNYGAFAGAEGASGGVVASRPVRQAAHTRR